MKKRPTETWRSQRETEINYRKIDRQTIEESERERERRGVA